MEDESESIVSPKTHLLFKAEKHGAEEETETEKKKRRKISTKEMCEEDEGERWVERVGSSSALLLLELLNPELLSPSVAESRCPGFTALEDSQILRVHSREEEPSKSTVHPVHSGPHNYMAVHVT